MKNHIKIYQTSSSIYSKLRYEVNEKLIFYCEKIRNSGNYINDYAYSFFRKDFYTFFYRRTTLLLNNKMCLLKKEYNTYKYFCSKAFQNARIHCMSHETIYL